MYLSISNSACEFLHNDIVYTLPILIIYSSFPWINSTLLLPLLLFSLFSNNTLARSLFRSTSSHDRFSPHTHTQTQTHTHISAQSICRVAFVRVRISQRFHCVKYFTKVACNLFHRRRRTHTQHTYFSLFSSDHFKILMINYPVLKLC